MSISIWLTVDNDHPDIDDIAKAQCEMDRLGIPYKGKVGIALTRKQWANFKRNLSAFESRFVNADAGLEFHIMGFPVRMMSIEKV